uniref:Phorbol-ester/DAG-type domain-containing protein n=2 Tax=Noccaea caerulescens TaxID=107243 RepID=A0A1J3I298_NOCCA
MAMAKLKHFSHSCPLASPEIVAEGICNICFKDESVEFACKPCNFDLCKSCSNLPQKVSHCFHSEHPLEFCLFQYDRKPGYIICSGCGNMSSCSFYECKKCEIYLDLGCALLKNIVTAWDARELLHYSHEHLLRRCRPGQDARGSCLLCELPLSPSSICYGCVYCYSFLHEHCLDLPTEIRHPVHPEHPLKRLDYIQTFAGRKSCDACKGRFAGVPFGCLECGLYLHVRCADSLLRGLMHESHEHILFYVALNAKKAFGRENPCQICMGSSEVIDSYFHCIECGLKFHFECLGIPKSMLKRSCHIHPLVCKRFSEEDDSLEYCGVCETMVYAGHHVYACQECDFLGHIECVLREEVPSPLFLKDLYSCGEDITRDANREDHETNELENKLVVNDIKHNHVMNAVDMCELSCKEDCAICKKEILCNPWKCESCVSFVTHDFCAELGKPSRHRFHWSHLLTLVPKPLASDMTMSCNSCREDIKGFNLFCRICNFTIHVSCATKGKHFLGMLGPKVVGIWRGRCLSGKHRMVQVRFSKSYPNVCVICQEKVFGLAVSCIECEKIYHPRCIDRHRSKDYDSS